MLRLILNYSNWNSCPHKETDHLNAWWMEHWKGRPTELLSVILEVKEIVRSIRLNYNEIKDDLFAERTLNNLFEQGIEATDKPGYYEAQSCVKKYNRAIFQLEDTMKDLFSYGYYCFKDGNINPLITTRTKLLEENKIRSHYISKIYQKLPEVGLKNAQKSMKGLFENSQKEKLGIRLPWNLYEFLEYTDNSLVQSRYFNSIDPTQYPIIIFFLPFYIELLDDLRCANSMIFCQRFDNNSKRIENDVNYIKEILNWQNPQN